FVLAAELDGMAAPQKRDVVRKCQRCLIAAVINVIRCKQRKVTEVSRACPAGSPQCRGAGIEDRCRVENTDARVGQFRGKKTLVEFARVVQEEVSEADLVDKVWFKKVRVRYRQRPVPVILDQRSRRNQRVV